MVKKTKDFFAMLPSWIKYATTIISLIVTLGGGLYAMDDRYVSDKEAAQSLQNFDMKMKQELNKIELQMMSNQLENITTEYYKHKQMIRAYPSDQELKEEFEVLKERRTEIKKEIKAKMQLN